MDPHYLSWKLRTLNYNARFIELAAEVNRSMPEYVVNKIGAALNDECKAIKDSNILILGVAYKPNVGDVRESPALDILYLLQDRGARLTYHDPFVPELDVEGFPFHSIELTDEVLERSDCVVVVTDHDEYDWQGIVDHANLVVDTRNAVKVNSRGRVVTL